jgi:hypothetical protein
LNLSLLMTLIHSSRDWMQPKPDTLKPLPSPNLTDFCL